MGKSSTKAKNKYNKTAYKRISLLIKPLLMDVLNNHCNKFEYSKNGFIAKSIKETIERETGKTFEELLKETEQSKSSD